MEKGFIQNLGRTLLSNVRPFFFSLKKRVLGATVKTIGGRTAGKNFVVMGVAFQKKLKSESKKEKNQKKYCTSSALHAAFRSVLSRIVNTSLQKSSYGITKAVF